jgi:hypothetical protein
MAGLPEAAAEGPSLLLSTLFHKPICGPLYGEASWTSVLTQETLHKYTELRRHAYESILGPELTRQAHALQEGGRQLLWLWTAVGEACQWLCGILKAAIHPIQLENRAWCGGEKDP